ncbi:YhcN/YlaJ family sporulation lipoprotein [Robertmurraya korlensis]|uniref:YhcN/YlaJ family sporulation lipoprotein n=1 Tax=Robertmurraya korlensis TaxID=519977 RepID=UPI00203C1E31|nr:YhcN/YlaJ family sporulation lipoprotein [Robertmurraya korlensis]MCM3600335.1 YhcN/YlaJ family sporulation lipoprotein [Robertmurraya korlensis]
MKKTLSILACCLFLSACGSQDNTTSKANQNEEPRTINVKNSTIPNIDRETGQEVSKHLVNLATSIPSVNDATAVVLGRYAIVGIDVNEDIDRSQVGTIKYTVAESLKNDPHGARAVVIADPDMTARLREIQEDIQSGEPIQGIVNELADISGRLMPEVPADIIDPNANKATEKSKRKLNEEETKELDKAQEKESQGYKD